MNLDPAIRRFAECLPVIFTRNDVCGTLAECDVGQLDGGCLIVALALQDALGIGTLIQLESIVHGQSQTEHYGLLLPTGEILDGKGRHADVSLWWSWFRQNECPDRPLTVRELREAPAAQAIANPSHRLATHKLAMMFKRILHTLRNSRNRLRSLKDPIHVLIESSNGQLAVCTATGNVLEDLSRYDNDDLRAIVRFDIAEWERHYRQFFTEGDIMDYGYWSRDTDPNSALWGRVVRYEHPEESFRKTWREVHQPEAARRYKGFTMNPCELTNEKGAHVSYYDPNACYFSAQHRPDEHTVCWSIYGTEKDGTSNCLSDHQTRDDAEYNIKIWREARKLAKTKP